MSNELIGFVSKKQETFETSESAGVAVMKKRNKAHIVDY